MSKEKDIEKTLLSKHYPSEKLDLAYKTRRKGNVFKGFLFDDIEPCHGLKIKVFPIGYEGKRGVF